MHKKLAALLTLALSTPAFSAVEPHSIPRSSHRNFRTAGLFEGGTDRRANLDSLRVAGHEGFERWVIEFSDGKRKGLTAPKFQLRYVKADTVPLPDGTEHVKKPARFIFLFRAISKNRVSHAQLKSLVKKSRYVEDIVLYPSIEQGDTAMEFILKDNVLFEPHQPLERQGRLVLDIKQKLSKGLSSE